MRRLAAAGLGVLIAGGGLLVSPAPAAQSRAATIQQEAVAGTNHERTTRSRAALKASSCLQRFAAQQAARMAASRTMYHQPLDPILARCQLRMVGENVAYGQTSGKQVVRDWMNSPGHRANILEKRYRLIGLAARQASDGTWYYSQVFGTPR